MMVLPKVQVNANAMSGASDEQESPALTRWTKKVKSGGKWIR